MHCGNLYCAATLERLHDIVTTGSGDGAPTFNKGSNPVGPHGGAWESQCYWAGGGGALLFPVFSAHWTSQLHPLPLTTPATNRGDSNQHLPTEALVSGLQAFSSPSQSTLRRASGSGGAWRRVAARRLLGAGLGSNAAWQEGSGSVPSPVAYVH